MRLRGLKEKVHISHLTHSAWHMVKVQEVLATIMFYHSQIESLISIINTVQIQAKDGFGQRLDGNRVHLNMSYSARSSSWHSLLYTRHMSITQTSSGRDYSDVVSISGMYYQLGFFFS